MAKKSKLFLALDAHKGRDYEVEKKKKQVKAAEKRKRLKVQATQAARDGEDGNVLSKQNGVTLAPPAETHGDDDFKDSSGSAASAEDDEEEDDDDDNDDDDDEETDPTQPSTIPQPSLDEAAASEDDPDSDVPLSDLSHDDRADTIPHQRMTINNGPALKTSTSRIRLIQPHLRFSAHNSLISSLPPSSTAIPDANDDLTRELEFYRIARTAATEARALLKKEGVPFTRPNDYFAEMAKTDEQMEKVKQKMREEAASKKAAAEARALRDAKKFGKAVQVAKVQERAKEKREMLEKISTLKRKRKGQDTGLVNEGDDLFENIDVEEGPKTDRHGRERGSGPASKRQKKDQKFGFGGKKRFAKSGDAASTADMRGFSASRMKGRGSGPTGRGRGGGSGRGAKRLGKSRRAAAR